MTQILKAIEANIMACLYILMGAGLLLASYFLHTGMITGDNWTTVCSVLFGSSSIGAGMMKLRNPQ